MKQEIFFTIIDWIRGHIMLVGTGIVVFIFLLGFLLSFSPVEKLKTPFESHPTSPTPSVTPVQVAPRVPYNPEKSQQLLQIIEKQPTLSSQDTQAKQALIASLNGNSGVLVNTATFSVEYVKTAGRFLVEIKDVNIAKTKQDALNWFTQNGFSAQSFCQLPIVFYLSPQTAEQLKDSNMSFNPLPDAC